MNCTWVDCGKDAAHPELDKQGKPWAHLCEDHHTQLEHGLSNPDIKILLSIWVKAQGGAKKATEKMMPAIEAGNKLLKVLRNRGAFPSNANCTIDTSNW